MKTLKIATVIPPHVTTQSYLNLAKVYSYIVKKYNAEITVFVDSRLDFKSKYLKAKKVFGFDSHFGLYKIPFFLGLPRFYYPNLVKALGGFDVIESSTPEFYIYALQSYHAAKKCNSKLVLRTSQTRYDLFLFPFTKPIALYFARKACRFASYLCFTNPQSRDAYFKIGLLEKTKKAMILGHAVDSGVFRPLNLKKKDNATLLSVAALLKVKGHQNVIKALKILIEKKYSADLWVVGKGKYERELRSLCKKLKVSRNVKFLGPMPHEKLVKIYNQAHIFVLANFHDVTPAASEAMLCKLPVVANRCGGIDFVIPSPSHGIITKPNDPEDLAEGIEKLILNKNLRNKISNNARKHILANFTIEKVAKKLFNAYSK